MQLKDEIEAFCPQDQPFTEPTTVQAETKLREQGILVPADSSGSESHSRFISSPHGLPPLPSDIDLGDISADFGSWCVRPDARIIVE